MRLVQQRTHLLLLILPRSDSCAVLVDSVMRCVDGSAARGVSAETVSMNLDLSSGGGRKLAGWR